MPLTRPKSEQINFDVTNLTDPLIRLNSGESGSADKDAGIVIERGSDTNVGIIYDESADQFAVINTSEVGTTSGNVNIASYANIKANEFHGDGSNLTGVSGVGGATGVDFDDNVKARFGTGNDLEIYHSGTASFISEPSGTGELYIRATNLILKSGVDNDDYIKCHENSDVKLYYSNAEKLATTSTGATVTGKTLSTTGIGTGGMLSDYTNTFGGSNSVGEFLSSHSYQSAISLRYASSAVSSGTVAFYMGTQASMDGVSSTDVSQGIYVQNGQKFGIGHGTARAVEVTADGDVRSRYWVGNGTGAGYKLNADSNQGMILIETNLTTARDLMHFNNGNGLVGKIQTSGTSTSFVTSSDHRLKENVDYDWDATTRLKQLKPARFNFIADSDNTLVDGFIAHEVSSVVPEAVLGSKDAMKPILYTSADAETQGESPTKAVGDFKEFHSSEIDPQGIDQSKLVPLLVKTIQELEARITALES